MKERRWAVWMGLLLVLLLTGCAGETGGPGGVRARSAVSRDVGLLEKMVTLPARPKDVVFQTFNRTDGRVPGPTDWDLVAVLQYDADSVKRITGESSVAREGMEVGRDEVLPWWPPVVKEGLVKSGEGYKFAGATYRAGAFFKPPLTDGDFVVVAAAGGGNSRYLVLRLECCGPAVH